jgi:NAD(P)-dependent dehydrogenase (short-subunit alcohol dehydrogenase family)
MPRYELRGRVALVTGGARGIGFATAQSLLNRGAAVLITDVDRDAVERATRQLGGTNASGLVADVLDRQAMQHAVAKAMADFGGLDILVANAGIASQAATVRATPSEAFERVLDVNVRGVARTVAAALPEIIVRRGHVVVLSSIYAFTNGVGTTPYAMSKAAVEQFGRALRVELVQHGASATVAYFGFVETDLVRQGLDADPLAEAMLGSVPKPLRKRLRPEVAGEAIARAIESRRPRIIRPRRWIALSLLRGIVNPVIDARLERSSEIQALVRRLDRRNGDDHKSTTT